MGEISAREANAGRAALAMASCSRRQPDRRGASDVRR